MNNPSQLIDNFSGKYHKQMLKVTEPLRLQFGITYFCYQHVSNDGAWTILGNNPDWLMHSAENKFYLIDPSLVNPQHYQSGVILADTHPHPEFQNTMNKHALDLFDLAHCLAIIEKTADGCDYYFLSAPKKHTGIYNIYLNKLSLLQKQFPSYFKQELHKQLHDINNYAVDLKLLKNDRYFSTDNVLSIPNTSENNFEIPSAEISTCIKPTLTMREKQCIRLYQMGKTAKETARILNISHRTVEQHFEHIKEKIGCYFKRELLAIQI